jgi:GTPase Era involved in 16S rRNA processing
MGNYPNIERLDSNIDAINEEYLVMDEKNEIEPLNVAVVGVHHAGKSSVINTFLRWYNKEYYTHPQPIEYAPIGGGFGEKPMTEHIIMIPTKNDRIRFYDTPGFQHVFEKEWLSMINEILQKGLKPGRVLKDNKIITTKNQAHHRCHVVLFVEFIQSLDNDEFRTATSVALNTMKLHSRTPVCVITSRNDLRKANKEQQYLAAAGRLLSTKQVYCIENVTVYNQENSQRDQDTENHLLMLTRALFTSGKSRLRIEDLDSDSS